MLGVDSQNDPSWCVCSTCTVIPQSRCTRLCECAPAARRENVPITATLRHCYCICLYHILQLCNCFYSASKWEWRRNQSNEDERFTEAVISIFTDSGHCMVEIVTISVLVSYRAGGSNETHGAVSENAKFARHLFPRRIGHKMRRKCFSASLTPLTPFTALGGGGSGGVWDDGHLPLLEQTANLLVLLLLQTKRRRRTLSGETTRTRTQEKLPFLMDWRRRRRKTSPAMPSPPSFNLQLSWCSSRYRIYFST